MGMRPVADAGRTPWCAAVERESRASVWSRENAPRSIAGIEAAAGPCRCRERSEAIVEAAAAAACWPMLADMTATATPDNPTATQTSVTWVTLEQFAANRGCSLRTVYRMIERGELQTQTVQGRTLVPMNPAQTIEGATVVAREQATEARRASELVHQVAQVAIQRAEQVAALADARAARAEQAARTRGRLSLVLSAVAVTAVTVASVTLTEARAARDIADRADRQAAAAEARADAARAAQTRLEAESAALRADLQAVTLSRIEALPGWSVVVADPSR